MEAVVKEDLMKHLYSNQLIKGTQHGFMKGKWCPTNTGMIFFMDRLTRIVDKGSATDTFYLDFAKAFNKVPLERLLVKLAAKWVGGELLEWIADWLRGWIQRVRVGEEKSGESSVVKCATGDGTWTAAVHNIYR